jgi:hypothetical protein
MPAVPPVLINQHSAREALGLTSREYRRMVRLLDLPCRRVGKLVLTAPEAWRGLLPERVEAVPTGEQGATVAPAAPLTADAVLARVGLRRAP